MKYTIGPWSCNFKYIFWHKKFSPLFPFSHQNVWLENAKKPKCCKFDEISQFYKLDKADNTWNTFWEKCSNKIAAKLQNYFFREKYIILQLQKNALQEIDLLNDDKYLLQKFFLLIKQAIFVLNAREFWLQNKLPLKKIHRFS